MIPTLVGILLMVYLMASNLSGSSSSEFSWSGGGDALDLFFEKTGAQENQITGFVRYIYDIAVKGKLGEGTQRGIDIGEILRPRIQNTLHLALLGFLVSVLVGLPAGITAAIHQNGWKDQVVSAATLVMASVPSFCLAIFLILLFCLQLELLPVIGIQTWKGYVLPTVILGAGGVALTTRMTRSAALEVLDQMYITTLRAKGLSETQILYRHVLKNVLVPIITVLNNIAVTVICGTLVVENFFVIPGVGTYLVTAVNQRNLHQLLGCILVLAVIIMATNLAADLLYIAVHPQVRMRYVGRARKTAGNGKGRA